MDEAPSELLAAFVYTLESLERSNTVVRALMVDHEAGRRADAAIIQEYRGQCDAIAERIAKLRAATLSPRL